MSYTSAQAKVQTASEELGYKCKAVHRDYTDFAGSNVSPLTGEQYKRAMKRYLEIKTHK